MKGGTTAALDVLCLGETLWDLETPEGTGFEGAARLALRPGGAAVNAALGLARGGLRVGLAAAVGDDALGRALRARIAEGGVDVSLVRAVPGRTGLVFVERAGVPRVVGYRGGDEPQPILPARWEARALLLTGIMPDRAQHALWGRAIRRAKRLGVPVVIDVNARPRVWRDVDAASASELLERADVLKASAPDLAVLGLDLPAFRALGRQGATLLRTHGDQPIRAFGAFGELTVPCRPAKALRLMGAGDVFTAALVAALLRGGGALSGAKPWERALRKAATLARRHVTAR